MLSFKYAVMPLFALVCLAGLTACPAKNSGSKEPPPPTVDQQTPRYQQLDQHFQIVVVEPVAISAELAERYPKSARFCQRYALEALEAKRRFKLVHHTAPQEPDGTVLLVRTRVTDMRLPSRSRGPVGSSYIVMDVRLVDAAHDKVLQQQQLTAIAELAKAAVGRGARKAREMLSGGDKDLRRVMGEMLAEYVLEVVPKR